MKVPATIVVMALAISLAAGVAAGDEATQVDALLARHHQIEGFNGTALVSRNGQVILAKGYGMANFEWSIPNSPDTRFRLGSVTKQFTSMLIMQLVEAGKLSLDAHLADVLPAYRKDTGSRITIRHLLQHTSGVPNYTAIPNFFAEGARQRLATPELVAKLCSGDLEFEPGTKFRYSNSGYVILGAVIEQVSGKPYEVVLKERILDPLGMKSTGYDHSETVIEKRAAGYVPGLEGRRNAAFLDMSLPHAAGALFSTVGDLYLWDQALYTDKLLSIKGREQMLTPGLGNYAFGWGVNKAPVGPDKAERTLVQHGGGIPGFHCVVSRVIEDRHLVVLLDNASDGNLNQLTLGVLDILYGRKPPEPRRSLARALSATIGSQGLPAAIAQYRDIKVKSPNAYALGEGELNTLGYALLGAGKTAEAIEVFKLNVEAFPESGNPHDSLGEAYMAAGQKELAIKSYARSLELDPTNAGAVRALQKLLGQ